MEIISKLNLSSFSFTSDVFVKFILAGEDDDSKFLRKAIIKDLTGISYQYDTVMNPELTPSSFLDKNMILDIHFHDERKRSYSIEMQVSALTKSHHLRFQVYPSRILSSQLKPREDYRKAKKVFEVVFLTRMPKGKKCLYESYTLKNEKGEENPHNLVHVIYVYMPYIHKMVEEEKTYLEMNTLEKFVYILETNMNHDILKAGDKVVKIMEKKKDDFLADEELSLAAYKRQLFQWANEMDLKDARAEGRTEGENGERKRSIIRYVKHQYKEDISKWIETLNEESIKIIDEHLYDVTTLKELQQLI